MRIFATAEVLVLKYATHDVTGLDGRYDIGGIPKGKVTLSALLPATGATVERTVEIEADRALEVNLEIPFDVSKYEAERAARAPAPKPPAPKP
jgi:hypothetical protein